MARFCRIAGFLVCAFVVISVLVIAAETPLPAEKTGTDESAVPESNTPNSNAELRIRDALQGDAANDQSGDVVLDDILGIIKQRGSILDGTSLDTVANNGSIGGQRRPNSARAFAAEQLLKASRLLESVGPDNADDSDRAELVKQMRAEAVKLLTE